MGFCHRCGEITAGKCSKCGGRSVASTIAGIISESGMDRCDRWQSQYADTILSAQEISNKPALASGTKRVSVTQSSFYNPTTIKKVCCCCSKPMATSFIQDNLSYCKECHLKLFNKGECPTCQKLVSDRDAWIDHGINTWHADCFKCFNCKVSLDTNPLIDLKNRPCCEACFNLQSGRSIQPSPSRSYSRTSELYLNQSRNSSRRPRIDREELFIVTPPRTPSPTEQDLKRNMIQKSIIEPSISLSKRPCHACHQPLGDMQQKKTKIPIGDGLYAWFHKSCFLCSKCHLPFKDGQCATDGESFYHAQCDKSCFGCKKHIDRDAFLFNDKSYHMDCFKCFGNGCLISIGQPIFELGKKPFCKTCFDQSSPRKSKIKLGGSKTCARCRTSISVMDDTPGPFTTRWHKKCLTCFHCNKQLDSAAKSKLGTNGESIVFCQKCF